MQSFSSGRHTRVEGGSALPQESPRLSQHPPPPPPQGQSSPQHEEGEEEEIITAKHFQEYVERLQLLSNLSCEKKLLLLLLPPPP